MTCTDGIIIDGRRIDTGDCSGPKSARAVLLNPIVDAAVLETARGGILREGLAFDVCDVAIVTNIGEGDHLGLGGIETLEQLARVKSTIVDVVAPDGSAVLKADDPLVADMARNCRGKVIFFALDGAHPVLAAHRDGGGRAVFVRDGMIVLAEGGREELLASLSRVPMTHRGRVGFQVENAMMAAAAAWSLGVPSATIRDALESFAATPEQAPGRFNVLEAAGATVILDYGHNTSSLLALLDRIEQFPHRRRSTVYTAAGDRRDEDIVRQAEILGASFDRLYLYEDACTRGRGDGEVIALMRRGLAGATRATDIRESRGEVATVEAALKDLQAGDLLLIQADTVDLVVDFVKRWIAANSDDSAAPAVELPDARTVEGSYSATVWDEAQLLLRD
jgi:cyanophycin synthetase